MSNHIGGVQCSPLLGAQAGPYRKYGMHIKSDRLDTEATCDTAGRPHMRYVTDGRTPFHTEGIGTTASPASRHTRPVHLANSACLPAKDATRAACVAIVVIDATGNGGHSVAGSLEAQMLNPNLLEQVARQLRRQLAGSVQ